MEPQHRVGQRLPSGRVVTFVTFQTLGDGTTIEEVHDDQGGRSVQAIAPAGSVASNQEKLRRRVLNGVIDNATFLASSPNALEQIAQVQALTRQVSALTRIVLGQTETTVGT